MKIAVGLSGGVDSAVAAALLKRQGHEVIGVTMSIWNGPDMVVTSGNACYGPDEKEDIETAREIARLLDIPYHVFPISEQYERTVLSHFRNEYGEGRTPNPCIICNARMKFGALPEQIAASGIACDRIATGHYARIDRDPQTGDYRLIEAADKKKDQTYFLHRLSRESLSTILFPLGEFTKERVREMAREWEIPVHDKEDSKGFFSGDYREILKFPGRAGEIVDTEGRVHGKHSGIWNFTIGQRKGLNIENRNLFVIRLDPVKNAVIVGESRHLYKKHFSCRDINWLMERPTAPVEIDIKIGNTHPRARGVLTTHGDDAEILFDEPQIAIAPGQSAVFYLGEIVLGGGYIVRVLDGSET